MRRALLVVALLLVAILLAIAVPIGSAFVGNLPLEARSVGTGMDVVLDGYTSVGVIDVGGGQFALVDAGDDPSGTAILAALADRKAAPTSVVAIFLTHGHPDHTAACGQLPAATTYAGAAELPHLRGELAYHGPLPRMFGPQKANCTRIEGVTDQQVVPVGNRSVTAHAIVGHTAGSTAWLIDGVLFVGDAAGVKAPDRLVGAPWVFSDSVPEDEASLRALGQRLRAAPPALVVPSHTGAVSGAALVNFGG